MTEGTGSVHRLAEEEISLRGEQSPFSTNWAEEGDKFSAWSGECVREWQDGGMQDREGSACPRRSAAWQTATASEKQSALREERKPYCFSRLQLLTPALDVSHDMIVIPRWKIKEEMDFCISRMIRNCLRKENTMWVATAVDYEGSDALRKSIKEK